ncbi:hypothetical protein UlMin_014416 [Ulmus minor]
MAVPSSPSPKKVAAQSSKKSNKKDQANVDSQSKRTKDPGVRVVGGRIYDSEKGKTCHQCRQKTMDFAAACKGLKGEKFCTLRFCHKCLLNRYGEKAEEVALLDDWKCPKCRGFCNCSFCMKKQGHKPTGMLVHTAKAIGLTSASELIKVKGAGNLDDLKTTKKTIVSPKKPVLKIEEPAVVSPRKRGKENSLDVEVDPNLKSVNPSPISDAKKSKKARREGLKEISNDTKDEGANSIPTSPLKPKVSEKISKKKAAKEKDAGTSEKDCRRDIVVGVSGAMDGDNAKKKTETKTKTKAETKTKTKTKAAMNSREMKKCATDLEDTDAEVNIPLPQGTPLTSVWGVELSPEDVGPALQFLEFCSSFGKVIDVKRRQAEFVLRELISGPNDGRRGHNASTVRFYIQILSLIHDDTEDKPPTISKKSWFQALEKCVSESEYAPKENLSACFNEDGEGYDGLDVSRKLMLLNFVCDEALSTVELRNFIDDENLKFVEKEKEAKEKVAAAKSKEKLLKRKLQDEVAQAILVNNGAPLSISEHEALVSQIKRDAAQAHEEILKAAGALPKRKKCDAVRTEPKFLDAEGHVFWKLRCCSGNDQDMLLQDIGTLDRDTPVEKWSVYASEQKQDIDKYISSIRVKRARIQSFSFPVTTGSDIEVI